MQPSVAKIGSKVRAIAYNQPFREEIANKHSSMVRFEKKLRLYMSMIGHARELDPRSLTFAAP